MLRAIVNFFNVASFRKQKRANFIRPLFPRQRQETHARDLDLPDPEILQNNLVDLSRRTYTDTKKKAETQIN